MYRRIVEVGFSQLSYQEIISFIEPLFIENNIDLSGDLEGDIETYFELAGSFCGDMSETEEEPVFQFYSKSSDTPDPGRGAGERITDGQIEEFRELGSMVGWRKVLSNFYMAPFKLDGRTWNSVEHYYHANKFKKGHPEFYELFTVESGSAMSKDPVFAKAAGGKTGVYKREKYKRDKDIVMDEDFFSSGRSKRVMEEGQRAKYTQDERAKRVLLATKNATLQHHVRGSPAVIFYDTMKIRRELRG